MIKTEMDIMETIDKLSKQQVFHCSKRSSSNHSEFLQKAIYDLEMQLQEIRRYKSEAGEFAH